MEDDEELALCFTSSSMTKMIFLKKRKESIRPKMLSEKLTVEMMKLRETLKRLLNSIFEQVAANKDGDGVSKRW